MRKYAMVFAAGKGTRLGEITQHTPKALINIGGKPLLYHILIKLCHSGFTHVVVNIHHHHNQLRKFLEEFSLPGFHVLISDETELLLETGGGLKHAQPLFDNAEHILLHNVDILSNIDLDKLYLAHCLADQIATLAVRNRTTSRYFLFNEENRLKGWKNMTNGETKIFSDFPLHPFAFSGIHVVSKKIFELMPELNVFSITDLYLDMCREHSIGAWMHDEDLWLDVGKPEHLVQASEIIIKMKHLL